LPSELQARVHAEVLRTRERSGWPAQRTLRALGVSRTSYYRWRRVSGRTSTESKPSVPVQVYEALPEEKSAVLRYACEHPEVRHRELSWRMVDADVAYLSSSTVYRILRESRLVSPWRRRTKRRRELIEQAQRANERWATDLMYLRIGSGWYYLVAFLDEYSRYLVHWELLPHMDGASVSLAAQAALETLPRDADGHPLLRPEIRSDNGSCYLAKEFRAVLVEHELTHQRITPHCPEENGLMERANRTLRDALDGEEFCDYHSAQRTLPRIVRWYNEERLHQALGYLRPMDYYRGDPERLRTQRRAKLVQARHRRREKNLQLRQLTLPLATDDSIP
jgi:putative transposase